MSARLLEISTTVKLVTEVCCACGIVFAMPQEVNERLRTKGGTFYCPNGHSQVYTEPDIEVLRKKLLAEQQRSLQFKTQLNGALDSLNATKKELRQTKRRVNAGVCPYCRRHFTNVERHIHCKHPEEISQ
ncbi:hypothetical protein ES704_01647 [subsurface metagenome]|jgi:hypothetical protein